MTYATQKNKLGGIPIVVVELDMDVCLKSHALPSSNWFSYSEEFDNAVWTKSQVSITANAVKAPDGNNTADKIVCNGTANPFVSQEVIRGIAIGSELYTLSVWLWTDCDQPTEAALQISDLSGGDIGTVNITITNRPKRYYMTHTFAAGETDTRVVGRIDLLATPASGDYLYAWGAQLVLNGTFLDKPLHYVHTTSAADTTSCNAAFTVGAECYNTYRTCQDKDNYQKIIKTYSFCQPMANLPVTENMIPALDGKPVFVPGKITPGKGLGYRASINIKIKDFPYHDRGIDPYVVTRNYTPEDQGTFWGKFLHRNPYFTDRIMRVRTGYLTDPWDCSNFEEHVYVITGIKGPDAKGLTITGKDVLTLADDKNSQCPVASTGKLLAGINSTVTSFSLTPTGIGNDEYPASGTLRIGAEEMTFTRSADAITVTARSVNGTAADNHDADDIVQLCKVISSTNIIDVIDDFLNNYVDGFDATNWIPYDQGISGPATGTNDEWDDEKADFLSSANVTRTISKPTGINKLIAQLTEQFLFNIFWHQTEQLLKIKAIAPPLLNVAVTELNEDSNILANSIKLVTDEKQRVSQVWVYYSKIDNTESGKAEHYHNLLIDADISSEGVDLYGSKQVKVIFADWITTEAMASQLASRIISRFADPPKIISYAVDAKDSGDFSADLVDINTRFIQGADGINETTRFEILQVTEKQQGHRFEYQAMITNYGGGLFGFIGPNTLLDYDVESDANKQAYAFIAQDSGTFSDGSPAYKII